MQNQIIDNMDSIEDTNLESQEYYGAIVSIQWSNNGWTEAEDISKSNYDWVRQHGKTFDCWNFSHEVHNIDGWHVGYTSSFNTHLPTEEKRESIKYLFFRSLDFNTKENKIIGYYKDPQFGAFTASDGFEGNIRARIDDMVLFKNPILAKDIASVGYKSNGEPKEISKQGYTYINKEVVDTLLQTQQQSYKEDIQKFKHVLEYFVAHLSYLNSEEDPAKTPGYERYLRPYIDNSNFRRTGYGWKDGQKIQEQISKWEQIGAFHLRINIVSNFGSYQTRSCYLNWKDTGLNVMADWGNGSITSLKLVEYDIAEEYWSEPILSYTLNELGLFDEKEIPTIELRHFFDEYYKMIKDYNTMESISKYNKLLKHNYNIILNGAPGTGKTFLAKEIAADVVAGKRYEDLTDEERKRIGFVQFHPSYDYTDFVEGLRPIDDGNSNVVFKRKDGIFKEFCKITNSTSNSFESLYYSLKADIKAGKITSYETNAKAKSNKLSIDENGKILYHSGDKPRKENEKNIKMLFEELVAEKQFDISNFISNDLDNRISKLTNRTIKNVDISEYKWTLQQLLSRYKLSQHSKTSKVFIIDEINRGELSKIFGELFFSIDPGYREKENRVKVKTQYQNLVEEGDPFYEGFYVPENVYIIGTMNDIDRSVESMDFAMRRRFTFTEITAKESERILDSVKEWPEDTDKEGLIMKMEALNSAIEKVEGLSSAFHLGGAYFKKIEKCESYVELWDQYLESIVKEYLRGMPKAEELLKTLKAAYNGTKEEEE